MERRRLTLAGRPRSSRGHEGRASRAEQSSLSSARAGLLLAVHFPEKVASSILIFVPWEAGARSEEQE